MQPKLAYKTLGGIVPCPAGWLVVPARLAGVTVNTEEAEILGTLIDVLEYKPKFDAAAIYAPVGGGRRMISSTPGILSRISCIRSSTPSG